MYFIHNVFVFAFLDSFTGSSVVSNIVTFKAHFRTLYAISPLPLFICSISHYRDLSCSNGALTHISSGELGVKDG